MTEREAIYNYFGDPLVWPFFLHRFIGPKGGLVNIVGLRHQGLVCSGSELYNSLCSFYGRDFDRWKFYHELTNWCAQYTGTSEQAKAIGKQQIHNGAIKVGNAKYFCIPERSHQQLINEN